MARHKTNNSIIQNQLCLVNGKRSAIRVVQRISIQLFAVLTILQSFDQTNRLKTSATHIESHEEEHLKNPLVLDLDTLYDRTRLAASGPMEAATTAANRRIKRSPTSGRVQADQDQQQLVDACQSKVEILTPYYATNSKGKLRTVVNSALMQQAIQIETCVRSSGTDRAKCNAQPDCGCEQKYKWHRLLVLDTSDSGASRGLFMDWFLYPSACVCRCRSPASSSKQFLRSIKKASDTPP